MVECPENTVNTTECLLRAILEAQSGFDWDPLNFAFTAAIGVLALIVAAITVFQGLLTAGRSYTFHNVSDFYCSEIE